MAADPDRYDLFVSYARQDNENGFVTAFIDALKAAHRDFTGGRELIAFFDGHDIHSFDDWQCSLRDGISHARLFVAFLSPHYFASEWCRREWRLWIDQEIAKHILSEGAAPVYFVEVPGFFGKPPLDEQEVAEKIAALCQPPLLDDEHRRDAAVVVRQMRTRQQISTAFCQPFADEGIKALQRADLQSVLHQLATDLRHRADDVQRAALSESSVPAYNKYFTGRLDELLALRDRLQDNLAGVICGVHGLGGIGKTELAFTYAHAFANVYPGGRFYVPCEFRASLREALIGHENSFPVRFAEEERLTPDRHFASVCQWLRDRLTEKGSILLVLDNVTDAALVGPAQTRELTALGPQLHLLATTRLLPPGGTGWLTLGELQPDDALRLMEKMRPFADDAEKDAARTIVRRLGGFALAVELTAAWLAVHDTVSYASLAEDIGLQDLEDYAGDASVELQQHNHERRLTAVLNPVLEQLTTEQYMVMLYAALLPPDLVPLPWLRALAADDLENLRPSARHADPFDDIIKHLERLALLTRPPETTEQTPRFRRVHRMVQKVFIGELKEEDHMALVEKVEQLVDQANEFLTAHWHEPSARWELEPFAALADKWAEDSHPRAAWLASEAAIYLHRLAEWTRAEPLMRRAMDLYENKGGIPHAHYTTSINNLATLLQTTNRLAEAEPLMRRALAIDEASFGKDHPTVGIRLNNLAAILKTTNRLADAEPHLRRALAIVEASFGKDHPDVALQLNNLAELLRDTNRLAEAEPLYRRALAINEVSYGKDHLKIAHFLNNLSLLLENTNRLAEAESLMRRALVILEVSLGEDHPDVAVCLSNLALLLNATNRLAEAEPLMRRALAIHEGSYGTDHPTVAVDLHSLAMLYYVTNRLTEAEPILRRAVEILVNFTVSTGHQHPHLLADVNNYAACLRKSGVSSHDIHEQINAILSPAGLSWKGED